MPAVLLAVQKHRDFRWWWLLRALEQHAAAAQTLVLAGTGRWLAVLGLSYGLTEAAVVVVVVLLLHG
jgi:hypothetical protein